MYIRALFVATMLSLLAAGTARGTEPAPTAMPTTPISLATLLTRAGVVSAGLGGHVGAPVPKLDAIRTLVIDPGHGGTNEGALGIGQIYEKHLVLAISLHLADTLRARYPELEVVLTRRTDEDVALADRIGVANALDADLFITIHLNAALNPEAHGYECYWVEDLTPILPPGELMLRDAAQMLGELPVLSKIRHAAADRARVFAEHTQREMVHGLGLLNRGVKRGNYTVLRRAMVPSVVIELGFLSHAEEGMKLMDPEHQATLVEGLVRAIEGYDASLAEGLDE